MDNETPRYATWIPEAGGYVANGNVVSKSPMYDEAGKLKLDVDTSVFGNTQPLKTQPQVANQAQTNVGVTTANIQGSGTDANAAVTNIGNMASLADNKQNGLDSVLSSPAMRSPSAGEPILTVEQQDLKEIQDAKARNDLQGMINGYVKLGRDTGADYSATISDLTKQRQQKIQTIDDQYLQSINDLWNQVSTAKSQGDITGDYTKYNQTLAEYAQLLSDQEKWRNDVGYAQSMAEMYRAEEEAIELDYVPTYLQGINDISNQIIQMYPAILNFEYNPNTDTSLYIAQGYAQSRVKETMNATGMYYSTMTQSAIAKAVAELVPVYEKMAREEMIENFKLLQTTANFLLDLEQTQFSLWKSQIELKWEANQEKRRQIAQAIENANARGYFTNEEAALLGVAPGTESPDARKRAQDKEDEIEAEARKLQQSMILADYNQTLDLEKLEKQNQLQMQRDAQQHTYDLERDFNNYLYDLSLKGTGEGSDETPTIAEAISGLYGKDVAEQADKMYSVYNIGNKNFGDKKEVEEVASKIFADADIKNNAGNITSADKLMDSVYLMKAQDVLNNNKGFASTQETTATQISNAVESINNMIQSMAISGVKKDRINGAANAMYTELFDNIINYTGENGKNDFDYEGIIRKNNDVVDIVGLGDGLGAKLTFFNQGDKAKEDAMVTIIEKDILEDTRIPADTAAQLAGTLSYKIYQFATNKNTDGYDGLKKMGNYKYLSPTKRTEEMPSYTPITYSSEAPEAKKAENSKGTSTGDTIIK